MSEAAVGEGRLTATRDAPVGGQAVLEGVMMRGVKHWSVAVRKPSAPPVVSAPAPGLQDSTGEPAPASDSEEAPLGPIEVQTFELRQSHRRRVFRLPLIRGVVALVDSMAIGIRALGISANAQMAEIAGEEKEISGGMWVGTIVVAMVFAVGLFFVVPVSLTSLIKHQLGSSLLFWLVEGCLRTGIFLGYLLLLSKMRDLRRVFEYHGAEHKVISCYEAEDELVPERAALYSRLHPRCGTSFLLIVMILAIFVFAPVGLPAWWILVLTRIVGIPVVAGLAFEVIKWAGRNRRRRWVQVIMYPGLQLQRLTTREPDLDQLAVSIAALSAVLERETPGQMAAEDLLGLEVVA
ncbi:MAG TPA: DUF1385 domain-containing protein [Solirubrobacteraceae bacterium]|nr:DUF1385 domain-containing protein [Solirubrobacteraceae bacterium]